MIVVPWTGVAFGVLFLSAGLLCVIRPRTSLGWIESFYRKVPRWVGILTGGAILQLLPGWLNCVLVRVTLAMERQDFYVSTRYQYYLGAVAVTSSLMGIEILRTIEGWYDVVAGCIALLVSAGILGMALFLRYRPLFSVDRGHLWYLSLCWRRKSIELGDVEPILTPDLTRRGERLAFRDKRGAAVFSVSLYYLGADDRRRLLKVVEDRWTPLLAGWGPEDLSTSRARLADSLGRVGLWLLPVAPVAWVLGSMEHRRAEREGRWDAHAWRARRQGAFGTLVLAVASLFLWWMLRRIGFV